MGLLERIRCICETNWYGHVAARRAVSRSSPGGGANMSQWGLAPALCEPTINLGNRIYYRRKALCTFPQSGTSSPTHLSSTHKHAHEKPETHPSQSTSESHVSPGAGLLSPQEPEQDPYTALYHELSNDVTALHSLYRQRDPT